MGEPFRLITKFDVDNSYCASEDTLDVVHNLVNTPLEGCHYECVHKESASLCFNYAFPNPLDHTHVFPTCSQPPISPKCYIDTPIENPKIFYANVDLGSMDNMFNMLGGNVEIFFSPGYFYGYDASLEPYCIFLVDAPRKIMWNTLFVFSFDFSMAFALLKRALTFFVVIIFMPSYCHA